MTCEFMVISQLLEFNSDAVFDDLFASRFPIKLRNLFGNLVSLNTD